MGSGHHCAPIAQCANPAEGRCYRYRGDAGHDLVHWTRALGIVDASGEHGDLSPDRHAGGDDSLLCVDGRGSRPVEARTYGALRRTMRHGVFVLDGLAGRSFAVTLLMGEQHVVRPTVAYSSVAGGRPCRFTPSSLEYVCSRWSFSSRAAWTVALKEEIAALRAELANLKTQVDDLARFRAWVLGVAAGLGAIVAFFAEGIRRRLGL